MSILILKVFRLQCPSLNVLLKNKVFHMQNAFLPGFNILFNNFVISQLKGVLSVLALECNKDIRIYKNGIKKYHADKFIYSCTRAKSVPNWCKKKM